MKYKNARRFINWNKKKENKKLENRNEKFPGKYSVVLFVD